MGGKALIYEKFSETIDLMRAPPPNAEKWVF